jgi:S1-C subfamily serine protease
MIAPAPAPSPVIAPAPVAPAPAAAPSPPASVTPPSPEPTPTPALAAAAPPASEGAVRVDGPPPSADSPVVVIPRGVLDKELQDFGALSDQVSLSRAPRGGFRLTRIVPNSFVSRIGLQPGDIVLRVDGRPLNGIEDASAAYAWLRVTDRFTVDVVREGRPVRLRYVITGPATAQR